MTKHSFGPKLNLMPEEKTQENQKEKTPTEVSEKLPQASSVFHELKGKLKKNPLLALASIVILIVALASLTFFLLPSQKGIQESQERSLPTKTFKVLHVMSYHTPWEWTESQLEGFKKGLEGLNVEYKVLEMNTKNDSSEENKQKKAAEAKALVGSWQPDLVYTNDDNAQKYFSKDYVNSNIPFVFSAVNSEPSVYGFAGSSNMTGVLEHEHFIETVNLLRDVAPNVKRIVVIYDDDPTWIGVTKRMKGKLSQIPEVEFIAWENVNTFAEYKKTVAKYQDEDDVALGLLGIHTFKDAGGKNIPWQDVLRWTAENSNLADFTFWRDRIDYGTLVAVAVSGYEQGLAAGKLARKVLVDEISPADLPMQPTLKGKPAISLAQAKKLGIKIQSGLLTSIESVDKFAWEK